MSLELGWGHLIEIQLTFVALAAFCTVSPTSCTLIAVLTSQILEWIWSIRCLWGRPTIATAITIFAFGSQPSTRAAKFTLCAILIVEFRILKPPFWYLALVPHVGV